MFYSTVNAIKTYQIWFKHSLNNLPYPINLSHVVPIVGTIDVVHFLSNNNG